MLNLISWKFFLMKSIYKVGIPIRKSKIDVLILIPNLKYLFFYSLNILPHITITFKEIASIFFSKLHSKWFTTYQGFLNCAALTYMFLFIEMLSMEEWKKRISEAFLQTVFQLNKTSDFILYFLYVQLHLSTREL